MRSRIRSSLVLRITLAACLPVVVALVVSDVLQFNAARTALVGRLRADLASYAAIGATHIDPVAHSRANANQDPADADFVAVRAQLRSLKTAAGLTSPVYTLRRDGDSARFVVMTNPTPFIGDPIDLRPGHRRSFESGTPGSDGPYADEHGMWLSAWAPVVDAQGQVVALVQADYDVATVVAEMRETLWQNTLFAALAVLLALGVAWWVARGIVQPIRAVARAAERIQGGDFAVSVPEGHGDEVGQLGRAINRMAKSLEERERLRTMFGRYMTGQVADEVLRDGISFEGELRPLTVLVSDIRGYTALTERLGATDVVALLNEYFAILVDEVVRHEGVVDKFMGDAMLCWFGAPRPQPDHVERAVATARAIMVRLTAWNHERGRQGLPFVPTGIGIASGLVVVGNIGSAQRAEYTAIGDAVNLASRLCGTAEGGQILVADDVRSAVPDAAFERVGPIHVKGVRDAVVVHRMEDSWT